jgi:hypothetical protein
VIGDPQLAPPRTDLAFLRRRSRPTVAAAGPPPAGPAVDYRHPRRSVSPPAAANSPPAPVRTAPKQPSAGVDYSHPARHTAPAADPLDLGGSAPTPVAAPSSSESLDLSETGHPIDAGAPASRQRAVQRPRSGPQSPGRHHAVRVSGRARQLLTPAAPTVTLTRVQSGVGQLTVDAVVSSEVGDLRIAAAYQLRSGGSSIVAGSLGRRFAPPAGRRPVLVAGHEDGYERIGVDLRQVRDITRLVVVAFSESRQPLMWGGAVVLTLFGGARVELPIDALAPGSTAVLLSIYNVDGELVVRAETETIAGDVREAARAYGYDRITWRDDRNPVE